MRKYEKQTAIIVAGCFFTQLAIDPPIGEKCWGPVGLLLPKELENTELIDIITGKKLTVQVKDGKPVLPLAEAFQQLPFAFLTTRETL